MGLPRRDDERHTYRDYLAWPEDVRYEILDGIAYLMSPAPGRHHQDVVGRLYAQLLNQLVDGPCEAYVAPIDVRFPKAGQPDDEIDTIVQPDVIVVCDANKLDDRGVRGAPDFVIEVLSPSTASHDHVLKRRVYERAGVREYWLVHPVDRIVTIYRLASGQYGKPEVQELAGDTEVGVLPGVRIIWDELVARLPRLEF